jgi:hypothetical protein
MRILALAAQTGCQVAATLLPMTSHTDQRGTGVVTPMIDFSLAPRGTHWDSVGAEAAIRAATAADAAPNSAYADCFFWHDGRAPERYGSYKLPYCDVIGDEIVAVPHAIFAVAGVLDGARGGVAISRADQDEIRTVVGEWYAKMADEFDDASIAAPWVTP